MEKDLTLRSRPKENKLFNQLIIPSDQPFNPNCIVNNFDVKIQNKIGYCHNH